VTAAPARHGPEGCESITGEVIGFILSAEDQPTVYVSGDNASLDVVREIATHVGQVHTAVIFAGAARTPFFDGALVTVDGALAAEAAQILGACHVVPAHTDSWAHLTETREQFEAAFAAAGLGDRIQLG
jgi:L-ascorbate metabolism protein UlaG (beta-lactamase superfamily)